MYCKAENDENTHFAEFCEPAHILMNRQSCEKVLEQNSASISLRPALVQDIAGKPILKTLHADYLAQESNNDRKYLSSLTTLTATLLLLVTPYTAMTQAGDMIHNIPELTEYASSLITVFPGDVLQSGTSGGTGAGRVERATGPAFWLMVKQLKPVLRESVR